MQSIVITLCWAEIAMLILGAAMAIASGGQGDAAGRAMGTAYLVIGVTVLLVVFVLPAMLLAHTGHALWLAIVLSGVAALPAAVLGIGGVIGVAQAAWTRLRRR